MTSKEFLQTFLRYHFAQRPVVALRHLGCFLRLENHIGYNAFKTKNKNYLIIMMYLWSGTNTHCFTVKEVSWWASLIDVRTHVLKGIRQLLYRKSLEILEPKLEPFLSPMKNQRARKQKKFWIQVDTGFKWGQILSTTQATCLNLSLQRLSNFNFLSLLQIIQSVLHGCSAEKVSGEWLYQVDLIHKCKC